MKNSKVGSEPFPHLGPRKVIVALLTLRDVQSILILKTQRLVVSGWPSSTAGSEAPIESEVPPATKEISVVIVVIVIVIIS